MPFACVSCMSFSWNECQFTYWTTLDRLGTCLAGVFWVLYCTLLELLKCQYCASQVHTNYPIWVGMKYKLSSLIQKMRMWNIHNNICWCIHNCYIIYIRSFCYMINIPQHIANWRSTAFSSSKSRILRTDIVRWDRNNPILRHITRPIILIKSQRNLGTNDIGLYTTVDYTHSLLCHTNTVNGIYTAMNESHIHPPHIQV